MKSFHQPAMHVLAGAHAHRPIYTYPTQTKPQTRKKRICPSGPNVEITCMRVANTSRDPLSIVNNHCGPGERPSQGQPPFNSSELLRAGKNTGPRLQHLLTSPGAARTSVGSPDQGRSLHLFWSSLSTPVPSIVPGTL